MGLFERPRRGVLPTLDRARGVERIVYSERELRAAITDAISSGTEAAHYDGSVSGLVRWANFSIVLGGPIRLTDTLTIPSNLLGLTIRGSRAAPITSASSGSVFAVLGDYTSIREVAIHSSDGPVASAEAVRAFLVAGSRCSLVDCEDYKSTTMVEFDATDGNLTTCRENRVTGCRSSVSAGVLVPSGQQLSNSVISGNFVPDVSGAGTIAYTVIAANQLTDSGTSLSITGVGTSISGNALTGALVIGGGSDNAVTGNNLGGKSITTSASSGSNVIVGNTNTGTITAHGTDSVANNT